MKSVLALAYYYPPGGGAGVQRTVKFLRYLPEFGYRGVVVAPPFDPDEKWTPEDRSFEAELAGKVDVHRLSEQPPPPPSRNRGRAERWLRLDSQRAAWWRRCAVETAVASGVRPDVIYATMSPWESGEAARNLSLKLGVPWVADLRDPWALDEMMFYPSGLHRRLETRRMGRVLGAADAIVMNTDEARRQLLARFRGLAGKPVEVITNGYDADDFEQAPEPEPSETFRIVHTGHLHTELGDANSRGARLRRLTGGRMEVDFLTRSHVYLMQALEQLFARRPDLRDRVELHLVGGLSPQDEAAITLPNVKTYGYVSHAESVASLRTADLLFLPMQNLPAGRRATIVPGKTYEYLASGRPILAALPDGDARDLLGRFERATVVRPDDVAGMAATVERLADAGRRPDAPPAGLEQYERRDQTRRLAELFDRVSA